MREEDLISSVSRERQTETLHIKFKTREEQIIYCLFINTCTEVIWQINDEHQIQCSVELWRERCSVGKEETMQVESLLKVKPRIKFIGRFIHFIIVFLIHIFATHVP